MLAAQVLLALAVAEGVARVAFTSPPWTDFVLNYPATEPKYRLDDEIGYLPRLGDPSPAPGFRYDENGINVDQSVRAKDGSPRVLFLGDSALRQGHLLRAIDDAYPANRWALLNAGVEGYNVLQEVAAFLRFSQRATPSRIVICIHNNDLTYIPMSYLKSAEEMFWYFPGEEPILFRRDLYRWSHLYRGYVGWQFLRLIQRLRHQNALPGRTRVALTELRDWCAAHRVKLQALVLPILRGYEEWNGSEKNSRVAALAMTKELGIETYDLYPPLHDALRAGVNVRTGVAEDYWHPSPEASRYFARYLRDHGLFRDLK